MLLCFIGFTRGSSIGAGRAAVPTQPDAEASLRVASGRGRAGAGADAPPNAEAETGCRGRGVQRSGMGGAGVVVSAEPRVVDSNSAGAARSGVDVVTHTGFAIRRPSPAAGSESAPSGRLEGAVVAPTVRSSNTRWDSNSPVRLAARRRGALADCVSQNHASSAFDLCAATPDQPFGRLRSRRPSLVSAARQRSGRAVWSGSPQSHGSSRVRRHLGLKLRRALGRRRTRARRLHSRPATPGLAPR